jgi:hypothetical protein
MANFNDKHKETLAKTLTVLHQQVPDRLKSVIIRLFGHVYGSYMEYYNISPGQVVRLAQAVPQAYATEVSKSVTFRHYATVKDEGYALVLRILRDNGDDTLLETLKEAVSHDNKQLEP